MNKFKVGFAIFWRMLALYLLLQLTIFSLLMMILYTPLVKSFGASFIMLKPTLFYLLFALTLFVLCNTKFLAINRFVWQRVFTIPLSWISCYRAYALVSIVLAIINVFVATFADEVTWVNYKLSAGFFFLIIPIVMAFKLDEAKD